MKDLPPRIENKESEYGHDVNVTVYLMRHAHKDSYAGDISSKGEQQALELKNKFDRFVSIYGAENLEVAHSGHKRPKKTAEILAPKSDERRGLTFVGSQEFEDQYAKLSKENGGDESKAVQMILDTGNERFDEESLSSVEVSQQTAKELLEIVEKTKEYKSHTKKPIALISHSGVMENFLVDLVQKRGEQESLKSVGGPVDFLEDMRLYVNRKSPTEVSLKFRFRDWEEELTEAKLKELAGLPK